MSEPVKGDPQKDTDALKIFEGLSEQSKPSKMKNLDERTLRKGLRAARHFIAEAEFYTSVRNDQSKGGIKGSKK